MGVCCWDRYDEDVLVDYRGADVNVANFLRVLTGRHHPGVPGSKRLETSSASNILIYMSGHGGDGFIKFQDYEELSAPDLADAFTEMHGKGRYNEILFIADTCQAASLGSHVTAPNVLTIGSSLVGQNSYAHHTDREVCTHTSG